jgi:salicylate hydroxylase
VSAPVHVAQVSSNENSINNTPGKPLTAAHASVSAKGVAQHVNLYGGRRASLSLNIHVVGCGLGGLAAAFTLAKAGHRITIIESAPAIGEVGAGIQVTPNLSRLLIRWGLKEQLESIAVRPDAIVFRRCEFNNYGKSCTSFLIS